LSPAKLITRKTFLKLAVLATTAGFVTLWNSMTGKQKLLSEKPEIVRIDVSKLGTGVFLFDKFIVVKTAGLVHVFSNKCTHAGCRINREINGELICPCHGSKYEAATGKVIQGPAGLPLPQIPFNTDARTGEIFINTQS
jgi:Rieske Fe-S protein